MEYISNTDETKVLHSMRNAGQKGKLAIRRSMRATAEFILAESQKIVPMDTGALAASGKVEVTFGTGLDTVATVSYGDANAPYAVFVHEDLSKRHGSAFNVHYAQEIAAGYTHERRPEEQAKFLEDVMKTHYATIQVMLIPS